jgi:hypothetical protein
MNKFTTLWVAGLAISFLTSCATVKTLQAYEGEVKPESEVAIVDCDLGVAVTIDGNPKYFLKSGPPGTYGGCAISLLPGEHTLSITYFLHAGGIASSRYSTSAITLTSAFEANKRYRVKVVVNDTRTGWKAFIVGEPKK